ncbi:hypothetical protein CRYUN_Cryun07bG0099800 [Craigia yunnanensis]
MQPYSLHLLQTQYPPTSLRPHGSRVDLHSVPKGSRLSLWSRPRRSNAKGPVHVTRSYWPFCSLRLRHDHSDYFQRPSYSSAGPGGFSTVNAICSVTRSHGGRVFLLTAQPETGSSVKYANVVAYVPAQTMADDKEDGGGEQSITLLPMGSVYEGTMFVLFEMVVYKLGEVLGENPEAIRAHHTNLE